MQEVAAALDDSNEGDNEEGQDLHHGADLTDPAGQEDVALADVPVKHFRHHPSLECDHSHDQQTDWQDLKHLAVNQVILIMTVNVLLVSAVTDFLLVAPG